ncbi:MAG: hypothetical protein ACLUOI_13630 [Eisenbergiella sp.]
MRLWPENTRFIMLTAATEYRLKTDTYKYKCYMLIMPEARRAGVVPWKTGRSLPARVSDIRGGNRYGLL